MDLQQYRTPVQMPRAARMVSDHRRHRLQLRRRFQAPRDFGSRKRAYSACMPERSACERRVYRLATLLTGDPVEATHVITQVVGARPDLSELDSAHLDRVTVLRSRDIPPATLISGLVPLTYAAALAALPLQQREAWVLARVYQTPPREMSRAMDCSTSAAARHLASASEAMAAVATEGQKTPAQAFLQYSMTLDVPEFYRVAQRRQRCMRLTLLLGCIAAIAVAIGALVIWWSRPLALHDGAATTQRSAPPATGGDP